MKSDHRHELKTNELAEWLANLPDWTRENISSIILIIVLIIAIIAFFGWRAYNKNVIQVRERVEFTNLLNQLPNTKMQIMQYQGQGAYRSSALLQPASALEVFAQTTNRKPMKALALIKQAEAIRAELHYGSPDYQYFNEQTNKAKAIYTEALEISKSIVNPTFQATAKFSIGLCEEELGNFENARQIYTEVAENPEFEGTIPVAQAKFRLDVMGDYTKEITFKPAPKAPEQELPFEMTPGPAQLPDLNDINLPVGTDITEQEANSTPEIPHQGAAAPNTPTMTTEIPVLQPETRTPNNVSTEPSGQPAR